MLKKLLDLNGPALIGSWKTYFSLKMVLKKQAMICFQLSFLGCFHVKVSTN